MRHITIIKLKSVRFATRMAIFFVWLACALSSNALAQEPELQSDDAKDYVTEILPYSLDFVHDHIMLEFDSQARAFYEDYTSAIYMLPDGAKTIKDLSPEAYEEFMAFPLARPHKFWVFYGAYPHMQSVLKEITPYAVMGLSNAALQRYATLPLKDREHDIYLWSPDAPFWHSEYMLNGRPLPFHTYFIIHLSAVDKSHTQVEVIEDKPVVKIGKKLNVDIYGKVHDFDIKDVEPTTFEREFMLSCFEQFIERKVPGRHWFNCKDADELKAPPPVTFTVP